MSIYTVDNFLNHHIKAMQILGYYITIDGKVFSGVSGRRVWQTKSAASRMLNYCLKLYRISKADLKDRIEIKPIELLTYK